MTKIPVGATIAHAYRFAFGQFFALLKLTWLPMATAQALNIWLSPQQQALSQGLRTHDYSAMTWPWPIVLLLSLVGFVLSMGGLTAAFQFALGRIDAKRWLYLPLGMPLWRLIGASLAMVLALAGLLISYVLIVLLVLFCFRAGFNLAHVSVAALQKIIALDVMLAFLAGYCGFIFCGTRFGFLLLAVTIAQDRIGLFGAWTLSHRNFWRMLIVSLAIVLPFFIYIFGLFYWAGLFDGISGDAAKRLAAQQAAFAKMHQYGYVIYPLGVITALWLNGVIAGAQSFAYRTLTRDPQMPRADADI